MLEIETKYHDLFQVGLVPLNHLFPIKDDWDRVAAELGEVVVMWGEVYKQMYVMRDFGKLGLLERAISDMVWWRHQLGSDSLTQEEAKDLRKRAANKIDAVNNKLGLEEVARDEEGVRVQIGEGCVNIFNAYTKNKPTESLKLGMPSQVSSEKRASLVNHHLHVKIDEVGSGQWLDDTLLYCQLYSERKPGFVSERWCVPLIRKGAQTVFIDLGSLDRCLDLYLVVQVFRIGKIVQPETQKQQETLNRRSLSGRSLTGQVCSHLQ